MWIEYYDESVHIPLAVLIEKSIKVDVRTMRLHVEPMLVFMLSGAGIIRLLAAQNVVEPIDNLCF